MNKILKSFGALVFALGLSLWPFLRLGISGPRPLQEDPFEKLKKYFEPVNISAADQKALNEIEAAVVLEPDDPYYYRLRGIRHREAEQYDKSLADLNRALQLDPEFVEAYGARGDTYLFKGDYQKAVADYSVFLKSFPKVSMAYFRRGQAYGRLKRYREAIADFQKAIELEPKSIEAHNSLAWLLATAPEDGVRNGLQAIDYARKALDLAGDNNYFYMDTLAAAYAEAGRFEEAIALQEQAVSLLPADVSVQDRADFKKRLDLYKRHTPFRE
ncbi:MAG: tetratricopeptide repeat protein [Candidatus Aminicenantales bacterium]